MNLKNLELVSHCSLNQLAKDFRLSTMICIDECVFSFDEHPAECFRRVEHFLFDKDVESMVIESSFPAEQAQLCFVNDLYRMFSSLLLTMELIELICELNPTRIELLI